MAGDDRVRDREEEIRVVGWSGQASIKVFGASLDTRRLGATSLRTASGRMADRSVNLLIQSLQIWFPDLMWVCLRSPERLARDYKIATIAQQHNPTFLTILVLHRPSPTRGWISTMHLAFLKPVFSSSLHLCRNARCSSSRTMPQNLRDINLDEPHGQLQTVARDAPCSHFVVGSQRPFIGDGST